MVTDVGRGAMRQVAIVAHLSTKQEGEPADAEVGEAISNESGGLDMRRELPGPECKTDTCVAAANNQ